MILHIIVTATLGVLGAIWLWALLSISIDAWNAGRDQ